MLRSGSAILALLLVFAPAASAIDFDREIGPLLVHRCLDCHSGPTAKGKLDLSRRAGAARVLTPGKPEASELWKRVQDDEMPPRKPLPAAEKKLLERWIAEGGKWGSDPIDPFRVTTAHRAGYDWWSLQSLSYPTIPNVVRNSWARNPIDRFILAKLEARGLAPSGEAEARTLLRRLSFDLTGLPPRSEEIDAFLADRRPDAYERLVDRLLASPAYGERYARHWLDVARFGESDGFERDLPRPNAWPYRDWVVRAFNQDLPFDEFARLQLAGDALAPEDPSSLAATGFLVAGPHDIVVPASDAMKASMRQDELEDIIGTVGQAFLGLTVQCARCHEHKFDPLSQRDYYRFAASLAGVGFGERSVLGDSTQKRLARARERLTRIHREIDTLEEPIRRKLRETKQGLTTQVVPDAPYEWDFTRTLAGQSRASPITLHGKARLTSDGLVVGEGYASSAPLSRTIREKTLQAWVRLDDLDQRGGGALSVQSLDGHDFDAIVFGERDPRQWMAGSEFYRRSRSFGGATEQQTKRFVVISLVYQEDGTILAYRDGQKYGRSYRVEGTREFPAGKTQALFGLRHGTGGGDRLLRGTIARARLFDRALSAEEVARSSGIPTVRPEEVLARLDGESLRKHQNLCAEREEIVNLLRNREGESARRIYAVNSNPPPATHLLVRGSVISPAERILPGAPAALAGRIPSARDLPATGDHERRAALARWMTDPGNPVFARVIVNRLWQHHFGTGIVDTPSDFGFNGGRPSHPELLDWLAGELIRQRWSLKQMHRLLVTSATYRQASRPRPEALAQDADNRLLWRRSPQRLEAEAVRDAILATSGDLDRTMGGAPFLDFRSYFFKGTQFYDPLDQVGLEFSRRSIYRMWARGGRNSLLDTFDCPDPSATTPRRAVTTTPLQALALLNNAFVLHQAERFAERLRREAVTPEAQARLAFRLAFGRDPTGGETPIIQAFVERQGLAALGRVIFNTNEFVQIE